MGGLNANTTAATQLGARYAEKQLTRRSLSRCYFLQAETQRKTVLRQNLEVSDLMGSNESLIDIHDSVDLLVRHFRFSYSRLLLKCLFENKRVLLL